MPAEWISRPRTSSSDAQVTRFRGGTDSGRARLLAYFSGSFPRRYKEVRNALEGWENSSKWSPWLANGSLSVREVVHALRAYDAVQMAAALLVLLVAEGGFLPDASRLITVDGGASRLVHEQATRRERLIANHPEGKSVSGRAG